VIVCVCVCLHLPGLACTYFLYFFSAGFQNLDLDTKLTVKNATDAKTPANSASRRTESNGRRPGPGFDQNPWKKVKTLFGLPEQSWVCLYDTRQLMCVMMGQVESRDVLYDFGVAGRSPPHPHIQLCCGHQIPLTYCRERLGYGPRCFPSGFRIHSPGVLRTGVWVYNMWHLFSVRVVAAFTRR